MNVGVILQLPRFLKTFNVKIFNFKWQKYKSRFFFLSFLLQKSPSETNVRKFVPDVAAARDRGHGPCLVSRWAGSVTRAARDSRGRAQVRETGRHSPVSPPLTTRRVIHESDVQLAKVGLKDFKFQWDTGEYSCPKEKWCWKLDKHPLWSAVI